MLITRIIVEAHMIFRHPLFSYDFLLGVCVSARDGRSTFSGRVRCLVGRLQRQNHWWKELKRAPRLCTHRPSEQYLPSSPNCDWAGQAGLRYGSKVPRSCICIRPADQSLPRLTRAKDSGYASEITRPHPLDGRQHRFTAQDLATLRRDHVSEKPSTK